MGAFQRKCEICGAGDWEIVYTGYIRDGSFGNLTPEPCRVARCRCCGVERLDEKDCKQKSFYEEREYRRLLSEPVDGAGFAQKHDILQLGRLQVLWPETFRQKVVADVGCAGGSFLDHVSGLAARSIAIEPCRLYHNDLEAKGYSVYSYTQDALQQETVSVDLAFTFSVIEHTRNPLDFLCQIRKLLKNDGKLWVSTPNRREILMDLLGPDYHRFFYRSVHRWYFDVDSFTYCSNVAGFEVLEVRCVHRFGLSNAMTWLRDRKPTGNASLPHLDDPLLECFWKKYLESKGVGDYLYFVLKRKSSQGVND